MQRARCRSVRGPFAVLVLLGVLLLGVPPAVAPANVGAAPPEELTVWPGLDGVVLTWRNVGPSQGWTVHRRVGEDWQVLASSREHTILASHTDTTLPRGSEAEYAVSSHWEGQDGPMSEAVSVTRPSESPRTGGLDIVSVRPAAPGPAAYVANAAIAGDHVTPTHAAVRDHPFGSPELRLDSARFGAGAVALPLVPAPGTYRLGRGVGEYRWSTFTGAHGWSTTCTADRGSLHVVEVAYAVDGRQLDPVLYTANVDAVCAGSDVPITAEIRWRSTIDVTAAALDLDDWGPTAVELGTPATRTATLSNAGTRPVTVGRSTAVAAVDHTTGAELPGSDDWAIPADGCAGSLAPGGSCTLTLQFRPTDRNDRTAVLTVPVDDGITTDEVTATLRGAGLATPAAPLDLRPTTSVGQVRLWVEQAPDTGGSPVERLHVRRRTAGSTGAFALVTTIEAEPHQPGAQHDVYDRNLRPGRSYEYEVTAENALGEGWPRRTTVAVPRHDLIFEGLGVHRPSAPVHIRDAGLGIGGHTPAAAPDGSRVVFAQSHDRGSVLATAPSWEAGQPVRLTVPPSATASPREDRDPAWSPDGTTIAFTRIQDGVSSVWTVPAVGGTPIRRLRNAAEPAWLPDSRSLVVVDLSSSSSRLLRLEADGRQTAIAGTSGATRPDVAPDGRHLVFVGPRPQARVGIRALREGATTSWIATADPDGYHLGARWSADATTVIAPAEVPVLATKPRVRGETYAYRLTHDGRLARTTGLPHPGPGSLHHLAVRSLGVHLTRAPALTGASARIDFGVTLAPAGTTTRCRVDEGVWAPCSSSWRGTGLAPGPHRLTIEATEPGGRVTVTAHDWQVDTTAPTVALTGPSTLVTTDAQAQVTYRGSDESGVASYDVRYRRARFDGAFAPHVLPASWQGATTTSRSLTLSRGYEYCFSVRARDTVGNRSAWSPERCTARPLDDRSLAVSSGWTRATGNGFYDGTITRTTTSGRNLSRDGVATRRVALIATTCPDCGSVEVSVGGTRLGTVSLRSSNTRRQAVLLLPRQTTVRDGAVVVRTTTSGRPVAIDGIAFLRH